MECMKSMKLGGGLNEKYAFRGCYFGCPGGGGLIPKGDLNFSEPIWGLTTLNSCLSHFVDSMSLRRQYNANSKKFSRAAGHFQSILKIFKYITLNCFQFEVIYTKLSTVS